MFQGRFVSAFFGDSIVWGQGLREEDKFSTALIQWMNDFHPHLRAFKCVKAHSGAIIGTPDIIDDPRWPGEVPSPYPTIHRQLASYDDTAPEDVDVVILDGGINDVGIRAIFNPRMPAADLAAHIRYTFGTLMPSLLAAAAARFPNPRTKILVLGYYPVISEISRPVALHPMLAAFGGSAGSRAAFNPWRSVVDNCVVFETGSDSLIQRAVEDANADHPGRFIWVKADFKPENSAFTAQPWVFGVDPENDHAGNRRSLSYNASAGHPNRWGARAYFNALYPILQREYGL